jgi:hypothetical protein
LLLLLPAPLVGQDSQWWTNQYGNRARLLGGAVIGSSRDLSAVYYNPGGLALVPEPEALLTGFVFELDNITYKGLLLENSKASSTSFEVLAGLIAGQIPFGFLGDSKLAYSYLTRHNLEYRFNEGGTAVGADFVPGLPPAESATADLTLETRLRESWGGLTWSKPVGSFGLGISTFVANRSQRGRFGGSLLSVREVEGVELLSSLQQYDYYNWRVLWKIGLATSFARWNAGLAITTPSVNLFGSGNLESQSVGLTEGLEVVAITYQDALPARYASSWAVAAGVEYIGEGWRGHAALEWFDRIDITILDAAPFRAQTDPSLVLDPDVTNVMKGLVNVALGFEKRWSEQLSGYGTVYTDFTGDEVGDGSITTTTPWNLWTAGAGAIFSVGRSQFTLGLTYKFGSQDDLDQLDLIPGTDLDNRLLNDNPEGSFWRLTLVLGFNLEFGPNL